MKPMHRGRGRDLTAVWYATSGEIVELTWACHDIRIAEGATFVPQSVRRASFTLSALEQLHERGDRVHERLRTLDLLLCTITKERAFVSVPRQVSGLGDLQIVKDVAEHWESYGRRNVWGTNGGREAERWESNRVCVRTHAHLRPALGGIDRMREPVIGSRCRLEGGRERVRLDT